MTTPRPSAEVQAELDAAEKRFDELQAEKESLEERLKAVNEEIKDLNGSIWTTKDWTKLDRLRRELKESKQFESDQNAIKVVFKESKRFSAPGDHIVSRVTAKRIYIRQPGYKFETQYDRRGNQISGWRGVGINLKETFGDDYNETTYRLPK